MGGEKNTTPSLLQPVLLEFNVCFLSAQTHRNVGLRVGYFQI